MDNIIEAIIMDEATFESTTDAERTAAANWLKQKYGTRNLNFMLKNYPGMLTRLVGEMRLHIL